MIKVHEKTIIFYTKQHCPLCDKAHKLLQELQSEISFKIQSIDIYSDDELLERYGLMIPVVEIDGEEVGYGQIDKNSVKKALTNF
ncbi:glutaredoxin family protein [Fictibacillus aquaticus]|uniref:Glutaredoxin n=1 Tax=Fictibacillus aquaticus TaxID=2021314 RepID=A0A235F538_9BACL|nr:glutaredoxin family protein [Fictibacillus aquaticus]OYD56203.1 glutaredoxin [Fictibacillus aquaticus]